MNKDNKEKCKWEKRHIIAGHGAGNDDYYCVVHERFSGDNHKYHPRTPKKLRFNNLIQ